MRCLLFALLLVGGSCFANAPWVANYERAKILLPALNDDSSETAKAWRLEVNRMIRQGRADNEIPLDAAKKVLARINGPAPISQFDRRRLVAAGLTEFTDKPKPVEPEQKPVIVYPTGSGNYRASDGTIILKTGDGFMIIPKK
jgi:hypothetical protein